MPSKIKPAPNVIIKGQNKISRNELITSNEISVNRSEYCCNLSRLSLNNNLWLRMAILPTKPEIKKAFPNQRQTETTFLFIKRASDKSSTTRITNNIISPIFKY